MYVDKGLERMNDTGARSSRGNGNVPERASASGLGSMFFFGGGVGGGGSGGGSGDRIRYERRDHYSIPYTNMSPEKQQLRIVDDTWERAAKYYTFSTNAYPPSPQGSVGSCASTVSSVYSTSASVSSASESAASGQYGGGHVPDVEFDRLDLGGLEDGTGKNLNEERLEHTERKQRGSMQ